MKGKFLLLPFLALALIGSSQFHAVAGQSPARSPNSHPQINAPESLQFTLQVPAPKYGDASASAAPALEGYEATGAPGDPLLPLKAYNIALPPDVLPQSVNVQVISAQTTQLQGSYAIPPAPPGMARVVDEPVAQWGENTPSIVDGKNTRVYQNDDYFPKSQLSAFRFDQLRKWRYVTLLLTPLQYNPVAGSLRLASEVTLQVTFQRQPSPDPRALQIELSDTVMDERAAGLFYNYEQARDWYPALSRPADLAATSNYVIITTKSTVASSTRLNSFVAHKQAQGYSVLVVTEADYGAWNGFGRASKIREWLANNYLALSIEYVLLIGDPTPYNPDAYLSPVGDVPMEMCWPAHRYLDDKGKPLGQNIPTDYLYANLTGNWNLDLLGENDKYCGELIDDFGPGGVSFQPEVYVGRIPVYKTVPTWAADLDAILFKTITYEDSGDMAWRKRALLPMSFSDYYTDGAYLGEVMKSGYLNAAGYDSYTLYQHYFYGGACFSTKNSNQTLVPGAVTDHWKNNSYGIVTWWAHGSPYSAAIGYGLCATGDILTSWDTPLLSDSRPAIVFQASCQNAHPELADNLGYSLLKHGAIATTSSTRNSIYVGGQFSPSRPEADNASMAYYITQRVVNGETVGKALYNEKYLMSQLSAWDTNKVGNWIDFNLYGDPSLSINDGHPQPPATPTFLAAASTPARGIKLTWLDNSDNETGFVVDRRDNPSGAWTPVAYLGINTTTWSDENLPCGSHYYYRVTAVNSYGSTGSNQADSWAVEMDEYEGDNLAAYATAIDAEAGYAVAVGQAHTFHTAGDVDWVKFNATQNRTYSITTSGLGGNNDTVLSLYSTNGSTLLATNDDCTFGNPASCLNDWVAPATGVYYIKVEHAQGQGGCAGYEYNLAIQYGSLANWPAQPTNLTATPVSHCQVNLAWTPNGAAAQGFEIERFGWKSSGGGVGMYNWQKIATIGAGITHYSDSGLQCSKSYPYRVRAFNANGKSFYSLAATAVTLSADAFESDNAFAAAKVIATNGTAQEHNFNLAGDVDWVKFTASASETYTITTSDLGANNDTVLELYATNGTTRLESNDDCDGLAACIKKWKPPSSGVYYVRVANYYGNGGCPGYEYRLSVTRSNNQTLLVQPSGIYLSDYSVSTLALAWPDPIGNSSKHAFKVERWQPISGTLGLWRQVGIAGPGLLFSSLPGNPGSQAPADGIAAFRDSWLTCNTSYNYRLRAFDDSGDSPYSDVINATTPITDSLEPDNDYTQAHTVYVNTLNSPAQNANLGAGLDTDWFKFTATAGQVLTVTTSQFTHSDNLTPTLTLYNSSLRPQATAQVCGGQRRALCINGWTAPAADTFYLQLSGQGGCPGHDYYLNLVDAHLGDSWPAAPVAFTGTLTWPDQIHLSWTGIGTNMNGFRLERRTGIAWLLLADLGYGVVDYTDAGLACGQPYEYRLAAYNASGQSSYGLLDPISTPACVYQWPGQNYLPLVVRR